ncbi:DUF6296 family protein [Streptomyces sp. NPDC051546]|uniref:DUF6296 family protein n=1 Tax=Streptomyces sp. NPDC051546 TaxID=3365655 RepID=UPI0037B83E7F
MTTVPRRHRRRGEWVMGHADPAAGEPEDELRRVYELVFPGVAEGGPDVVRVTATDRSGPGGNPVYEDSTGIIQAEISELSEVRVLATGAGQEPAAGVTARPVPG